jgi:hypothetical protein
VEVEGQEVGKRTVQNMAAKREEAIGSQTIQFLHLPLFSLSPSYFIFISLFLTSPSLSLS